MNRRGGHRRPGPGDAGASCRNPKNSTHIRRRSQRRDRHRSAAVHLFSGGLHGRLEERSKKHYLRRADQGPLQVERGGDRQPLLDRAEGQAGDLGHPVPPVQEGLRPADQDLRRPASSTPTSGSRSQIPAPSSRLPWSTMPTACSRQSRP